MLPVKTYNEIVRSVHMKTGMIEKVLKDKTDTKYLPFFKHFRAIVRVGILNEHIPLIEGSIPS